MSDKYYGANPIEAIIGRDDSPSDPAGRCPKCHAEQANVTLLGEIGRWVCGSYRRHTGEFCQADWDDGGSCRQTELEQAVARLTSRDDLLTGFLREMSRDVMLRRDVLERIRTAIDYPPGDAAFRNLTIENAHLKEMLKFDNWTDPDIAAELKRRADAALAAE